MVKKQENTEQKIITAAREVFLKNGMDGARMQQIADEAGINKSLLHYYFRSKDKLFDKVFTDTFSSVIETINDVFEKSNTLESFIRNFVNGYTKTLIDRPYIPNFVFHELSKNPDRVVKHMSTANFDKKKIFAMIANEDIKKLKPVDPVHILIDVLALSVFPFIARPVITGFILDGDDNAYEKLISERAEHIIDFLHSAIYISK